MSRGRLSQLYHLGVIAITLMVAIHEWAVLRHPFENPLIFFTALVLVATFLRVRYTGGHVGFEMVVAFPVIILFQDPQFAAFAVFAANLIYVLATELPGKRLRLVSIYNGAELALSFFLAGLIYVSMVNHQTPVMTRAADYVILSFTFLFSMWLFRSIDRRLAGVSATTALGDIFAIHGKTVLLISPIVAVEVMIYQPYGQLGFVIAFLPVLLVAYVMRNESEMSVRNVSLLRRNRELALLSESGTALLGSETVEETLKRLISSLSGISPMKAAAIVAWEGTSGTVMTVFRFGACQRSDQELLRWVDTASFDETLARPHQTVQEFPLSDSPAYQSVHGIQTAEVSYGVLIYESEDESLPHEDTRKLFSLLVNQAALALQDQLLRREMHRKTLELERRASTMATILRVSEGLIGDRELDRSLTSIAEGIRESLQFDKVLVALADQKQQIFSRRAHAGLDENWSDLKLKSVAFSEIMPLMRDRFRISNSYFISHLHVRPGDFEMYGDQTEKRREDWHPLDLLIVPLISGDELVGYFSVGEPRDHRVPTTEKVQTLEVFANQAVMAIDSAGHYDEIRRLTFVDSLTPAYNHRFFQESLVKEIHRHERTRSAFSLVMLDIDNFKACNDTYGHPVGDEILKGLVDELIRNVRDLDVVARYGGEEFAIILPETSGLRARDVARRLRGLVAAREFIMPGLPAILRITISLGVAVFPDDATTGADLIARADAALYRAKKLGKNQVVMAGETIEVG